MVCHQDCIINPESLTEDDSGMSGFVPSNNFTSALENINRTTCGTNVIVPDISVRIDLPRASQSTVI